MRGKERERVDFRDESERAYLSTHSQNVSHSPLHTSKVASLAAVNTTMCPPFAGIAALLFALALDRKVWASLSLFLSIFLSLTHTHTHTHPYKALQRDRIVSVKLSLNFKG